MNHDECVREMYQSLILAGALTVVIFSFAHKLFNSAAEVMAFWIGTHFVLTYAVWTVIDIKKRRDAWQSNHGMVER